MLMLVLKHVEILTIFAAMIKQNVLTFKKMMERAVATINWLEERIINETGNK